MAADRGFALSTVLVRDGCARADERRCPAPKCGRRLQASRARYCSGACRMRALPARRLAASEPIAFDEVTGGKEDRNEDAR